MIKKNLNSTHKQLLIIILMVGSCFVIGIASASTYMFIDQTSYADDLYVSNFSRSNTEQKNDSRLHTKSNLSSVRWAHDSQGRFLSKSDVIRAVKKRYNARVLKINLKKSHSIYNVRILMPSGKIKNIQINARR